MGRATADILLDIKKQALKLGGNAIVYHCSTNARGICLYLNECVANIIRINWGKDEICKQHRIARENNRDIARRHLI